MTMRSELLDRLQVLSEADPSCCPVVTLDEYFVGNDDEESIAPNNWGYGRPSIQVIYRHFKEIESRADVQGVYVGLHDEWSEALEDDELWPAAENVHVISSAAESEVQLWVEGLEADGVGTGWPYGEHKLSPKPLDGYTVYTVYWD
ncbi:hypothetical protein KUV59_14460 [Marinobacter daepoensis]|uniref:hypothetical protein n=1 Tax=Marinobacter daepoensis TaxID=262077 RepID=UPI001C98DBEF|nr:hypothetical protein [Marinobacter daepoensis]MBY6034381.1 hypothetical protein [Marinobacter daepoensis]